MNVLLVASKYPPEYSGSAKRLHDLYRRLKSKYRGITWQVLSTRGDQAQTGFYGEIPVYRVPGAREVNQSLPWLILRFMEVLYGLREFMASFGYLKRLKFKRVNIVHTCGWSWCVIAACFWARRKNIPIIRELTSMTDHPYTPSWMRPIIRITLKWATMIVAISPYLAEQCEKAGLSRKIWCRPNPIDETRFRLAAVEEKAFFRRRLFSDLKDKDATLLLNVGRIRPLKNQLVLIDILSNLPDSFYLVLAGPVSPQHKNYLKKICEKVDKLKLRDRVIFAIGYNQNPEYFMQAADLFLFPSTSEGLGTVVLEALMCGLPVIAKPLKGITDTIIENGRNGFITSFQNMEIIELIKNASCILDSREKIAHEAKKRYSANRIDRQYFEYLNRLASKRQI